MLNRQIVENFARQSYKSYSNHIKHVLIVCYCIFSNTLDLKQIFQALSRSWL